MILKIIGESGGTKTDWCFIDEKGECTYFSGVSYHPNHVNAHFIAQEKIFWAKMDNKAAIQFLFYGSGCLSLPKKEFMHSTFQEFGFSNIQVESDIIAAAIATGNYPEGNIVILGTGSVFAQIKNGEIINLKGGLGYLLEDEGSGYFFGKLFLKAYLNNQLSEALMDKILLEIGNRAYILEQVYNGDGKKWISSLAFLTKEWEEDEILQLHKENIHLFFDSILDIQMETKKHPISFVGSYAYAMKKIIEDYGMQHKVEIGVIIEKPMKALADKLVNNTFK